MSDIFRLIALALLFNYVVLITKGLLYLIEPPRAHKVKRETAPSMIQLAPPAAPPAHITEWSAPILRTLNHMSFNRVRPYEARTTFDQISQTLSDDLMNVRRGIAPEDLGTSYSQSVKTLQGRHDHVETTND